LDVATLQARVNEENARATENRRRGITDKATDTRLKIATDALVKALATRDVKQAAAAEPPPVFPTTPKPLEEQLPARVDIPLPLPVDIRGWTPARSLFALPPQKGVRDIRVPPKAFTGATLTVPGGTVTIPNYQPPTGVRQVPPEAGGPPAGTREVRTATPTSVPHFYSMPDLPRLEAAAATTSTASGQLATAASTLEGTPSRFESVFSTAASSIGGAGDTAAGALINAAPGIGAAIGNNAANAIKSAVAGLSINVNANVVGGGAKPDVGGQSAVG
jgi:hypothetical protein